MSSLIVAPSIVVSGPLSSSSDERDKWSCRDVSGISNAKGGSRKTATGQSFSVLCHALLSGEKIATEIRRKISYRTRHLYMSAVSARAADKRYQLNSRGDANTHRRDTHLPAVDERVLGVAAESQDSKCHVLMRFARSKDDPRASRSPTLLVKSIPSRFVGTTKPSVLRWGTKEAFLKANNKRANHDRELFGALDKAHSAVPGDLPQA
jgi:hypothetical protein